MTDQTRIALERLKVEIRASSCSDPSFDTNRQLKRKWADELDNVIAELPPLSETDTPDPPRVIEQLRANWKGLKEAVASSDALPLGLMLRPGNPFIGSYVRLIDELLADTPDPQEPSRELLYQELIYAVEGKWPGETRHQTALRYIKEAESRPSSAGCAAAPSSPPPQKDNMSASRDPE